MAHGEDRKEHAGQPEPQALFKGSDADIQEQARSWRSEDELEHPYG